MEPLHGFWNINSMAKAVTFINCGEIATTFDCRPRQNRVVYGPAQLDTQVKRAIMFMSLCTPQHTINFISPSILYCFWVFIFKSFNENSTLFKTSPNTYPHLCRVWSMSSRSTVLFAWIQEQLFESDYSTKLVRWNERVDCCSWEGVACSKGRVVSLYLDNEPIYGGLNSSSSLFRLHYLQYLSLANNDVYGPHRIPPKFGNLTNLSYLNLSNAGFEGRFPLRFRTSQG